MSVHGHMPRLRWILAVLSAALLPVAACGPDETEAEPGTTVGAVPYVKVVNVESTPVETSAFTSFVRITGEAEAENDITVSAEEGGRVVRFYADRGDRVGRGAAIAKIDLFKDGKHIYTDYLSLLELEGGWIITDKVYHRHTH